MWGNTLGWSISAVLVALMLVGVEMINRAGDISPPTAFGKDANNLAVLEFAPTSPRAVVVMTETGDAGSAYRQAIADYQRRADLYDKFATRGVAADVAALAALKQLIDATHLSRARIFVDHPSEIVNYQNDPPPLLALKTIASCAARAALLVQKTNRADAMRDFEAEFALGSKLFDERLTSAEMLLGLQLMSESAAGLLKLCDAAGDANRAKLIASFNDSRLNLFDSRIAPVLKVLQSADSRIIGQHTGDMFYLAQNAADRVWRVEAVLSLGRMKYFVGDRGTVGDQRGAMRFVRKLADDANEDAVIRQAARAARDLTIEQYRKIH
jgi:hypothetical protein